MASKIQTVVEIVTTGLNSLKKVEKLFTSIFKKQQAINRTALKFNKVRASTRRVKGTGLNLSTNQDRTAGDKASAQTRRYTAALNKANEELNEYVRSLATVDGAQNKFTGSSRKITTQVSALQERLNSLSRTNKEYTSTLQATLRGEQALYKVQRNRAVDELAQFPEQRLKKDGTPDKRFTRTGVEDLVGTTIGEFDDGKVAKSINGLDNYIGRLEALKAKVELGGASFRKLEEQISRVNRVLEEGQLKGQSSKIEAAAKGPATKLDSMDAFRQKERFASDLNKAEDKRLQLLSRINDSSIAEVTKQKLKNKLSESDVQLQQKELELARATNKEVDKELSSLNKKQQRQQFRAGRRGRVTQSALIGGGFPFLFGGGPLQAIAGALGGGIGEARSPGGGFAGSIAATAAISQISQAVQGVTELGQALNPLTMDIGKLVEKIGILGTEEARRIQIIEETQGKQAALAEATKSMSLVIGNQGVESLKRFGTTMQNIQGGFSRFGLRLQSGFAQLFNNIHDALKNRFPKLFSGGSVMTTEGELSEKILNREFKVDAEGGARSELNRLESERAALQKQLTASRGAFEPPKEFDFLKGGGALFPSQAEAIIEENKKTKAIEASLEKKNEEIKSAQKLLNLLKGTSDLMAKNEIAEENAGLLLDHKLKGNEKNIEFLRASLKGKGNEFKIDQQVAKIRKEITDEGLKLSDIQEERLEKTLVEEERLKKQLEMWTKIKDTIATGLTSAIQGLIDGTKSLSESLSGILKQIAQIILQKAILSAIDKIPFGGGGVTKGSVSDLPKVAVAAQGAYFGNGIKPFSTGGMATRPTLGLIGEAGESEYIIPASKMAASMQRYSAGARGEAVIPGTGSSYAGGGAGGSTTVNYSGPILNFNSEEFVPKSAIGEIIATATSQGAKAGENRTLTTLRNSRSTRSRLGM